MTTRDLAGPVAPGCLVARVPSPTLDGASLAALPGDVLARRLHRLETGARYIVQALDDLEVDLLKSETDDQTAHRVCNITRCFKRLTEGT